jgi:hypothetical protein
LLCDGGLKDFATLSVPDDHPIYPLGFSSDMTRLHARDIESNTILIWDLGLIRQQLAGMGLANEWPEFPRPLVPGNASPPPKLTIVDTAR